jgi:methylenetetrahydrofolate reductase (NADPH)
MAGGIEAVFRPGGQSQIAATPRLRRGARLFNALARMQFIRDIYQAARAASRPVISFEFFTPKTDAGERRFFAEIMPQLAVLRPDYCSVTYGAGGSTRGRTFDMVEQIQRDFGIPAMAHLTCVGATRENIRGLLQEARARGIQNLLALRGDPPEGAERFEPAAGGFRYAVELVRLIREVGGFSIGVAGFPEGHPECAEGKLADWRYLRSKVEAGADFVLSQLFFDNTWFHEFRAYLTGELGVRVPVVPGILAILNGRQLQRLTSLCGATVPKAVRDRLVELDHDDAAAAEYGIELAAQQCADLLERDVPGLHFYTLNKVHSTRAVLRRLGLRS